MPAPRITALVAAAGFLVACSPAPAPTPPPSAAPPAPPAACLLDPARMAAATGTAWTPDQTTASDSRCVYDAAAGSDGPVFLAVTLAPATQADPAAELESLAQLCATGSRTTVSAAKGGLVCRFGPGLVFGALVRGQDVVTVTVSAVPASTTGDRLAAAITEQLARVR